MIITTISEWKKIKEVNSLIEEGVEWELAETPDIEIKKIMKYIDDCFGDLELKKYYEISVYKKEVGLRLLQTHHFFKIFKESKSYFVVKNVGPNDYQVKLKSENLEGIYKWIDRKIKKYKFILPHKTTKLEQTCKYAYHIIGCSEDKIKKSGKLLPGSGSEDSIAVGKRVYTKRLFLTFDLKTTKSLIDGFIERKYHGLKKGQLARVAVIDWIKFLKTYPNTNLIIDKDTYSMKGIDVQYLLAKILSNKDISYLSNDISDDIREHYYEATMLYKGEHALGAFYIKDEIPLTYIKEIISIKGNL